MWLKVTEGIAIPFIGTAAGSACVFFMKKKLDRTVRRALAGFAGGVMVAASVWSLLAGKTVLVIAHRVRTGQAADKIVVLKEGRVAEEGAPKELYKNESGIFRRMTDLQASSAAWSV